MRIMGLKYNYHTHTFRCNHCEGTEEQMIRSAIKAGIKELGFSDHMPWPKYDGEVQKIRMQPSEIDDYVHTLLDLKKKYEGQIEIYIGFEAEYFPERSKWLWDVKENYPIDYFILGQHYHEFEARGRYLAYYDDQKNKCKYYYSDCEEALRSGLFAYFAHPDIFMANSKITEEEIATARKLCKLCKELDIPMEYNLAGCKFKLKTPLCYPRDEFWKIVAEEKVKVIIGGDYHDPYRILDDPFYENAYNFLSSLGLEILEKIDLKK